MDKPIPAFYCVYLLRSIQSKTSLYIGSTPNPSRRLKQHNGLATGGAHQTSRARFRPWKMAIIVTGFPSKIAALQFEWAWQHPHLTRHLRDKELESEDLLKFMQEFPMRRQKQGPRSLSGKLLSLISLLRARSFNRWPLQLRLFDPEAVEIWQKRIKRSPSNVASHLSVCMQGDSMRNEPDASKASKNTAQNQTSTEVDTGKQPEIDAIDTSYRPQKSHAEKSLEVLSQDPLPCCARCGLTVDDDETLALTCPAPKCSMVAHFTCLGNEFLQKASDQETILPVQGHCPKCMTYVHWADLVRDLTLRTRGKKDVEKLFRKPGGRKTDGSKVDSGISGERSSSDNDDDDHEDDGDEGDEECSAEAIYADEHSPSWRKPSRPLPSIIANSDYEDIDEVV